MLSATGRFLFQPASGTTVSAPNALHQLTGRRHRVGKNLPLRHLSPDCRQLLSNAGALIDVNVEENPLYTVVGAGEVARTL